MKKIQFAVILLLIYTGIQAQRLSLQKGWKFKTGDSAGWSAPTLDDRNWQDIDVTHQWERQGYPNYDGFAWYRLRMTIPSSLRKSSFFRDSIRIDLGYIDDGGEVYLNGRLVYKNWTSGDIKSGLYGPGIVTIAVNDPALLWDQPNVLAVRIFDSGGDGGIYGPDLSVRMASAMDDVVIDTDEPFVLHNDDSLTKKVVVRTSNGRYHFNGRLQVKLVDPASGAVILTRTQPAVFTDKQAMVMKLGFRIPAKRSYAVSLTYTDTRSGAALTVKLGTPYILTPQVSPKPRLNSAAIYGARTSRPFLYKIPATGAGKLKYAAVGLPAGLTLDGSTGIITGSVDQAGDYPVALTVTNRLGSAKKTFTIHIGSSIGLTPVLGWNSWNAWGLSVDDSKVRISARALADQLSAHGWAYINIDDGWEAPNRSGDGRILTNEKFPDLKATADYVHSLGLKFGIYSSPGPTTCGGYLGSWQHELQDARSYGAWGIDYLKYDLCSYRNLPGFEPSLEALQKPYVVMRAALDSVPRDIIYSFCQYGMGDVWTWGATVGGNSWRTTGDITDSWESLSDIGFSQNVMAPFADPGHFNDPDMLVVGKVGWGSNQHDTHLTPDEQYTHISLWCLLSSPLLIGCDLGHVDNFTLNLLTNDEVLAIDQDSLGISARQVVKTDSFQVWEKKLADGGVAVGLFNTATRYQAVPFDREKLGLVGYDRIRDLWRQKTVGPAALLEKIPPHGVLLLKFYPVTCGGGRGPERRFIRHVLTKDFISEGVAIADVNRDGKPDILAGAYWFEAPGWTRHELAPPKHYDPSTQFSNSFLDFSLDVNLDGWPDLVRISLPGEEAVWYENPHDRPGNWKEHPILKNAGNESPTMVDVNGDGRPDLLCNDPIAKEMIWMQAPTVKGDTGWTRHVIGKGEIWTGRYTHGLGLIDMNGDGRKDVVITKGWWECPADAATENWVFHPANLGEDCSQIYALDVKGNGQQALVSASAHRYGIWWHEKTDTGWVHHLIYDKVSETHAMALADVNGDGYPDLVTGKRYFAHNGEDPGAYEPSVLYWFEFKPGAQPEWIPHLIDDDSGVGLQVLVQDINGDGLKDIIVSNKKGLFIFEATN